MSRDLRPPLTRPGAAPLAGHALRLGAVALALAHLVAQGQTPFNPFMQAPAGAAAPAPVNPFSQAPAAAPSPATAPSVPAAAQLPVRTLPAPLTPAPAPAASAPPPVPVPVPPVSPNPAPVFGQMPAPAAPAAPAGMAPLPPAGAVSAPPQSARSASQPSGSGRVTYAPALPTTPSGGVTLRFDNAEIYDVIQVILGDILRVDYVIDPSVQGRITIKSTEAVSPADIFNVLESALAMSNISIVRQGKTYRVTRDANAVRDVITGDPAGPGSPLLQVIPVRFVQASQLVNTLRNFIGPQAAITNDPTNKYLIVADRAANVAKIIDMVKVLDVDYLDKVRVRLVQAERADAADLAKEAEALFRTSGLFNIAGTDNTKVYFLPVVRMNAVLVAAANDPLANAAEQWIRMLDVEPKNSVGSMVHVYAVANTNVAHLAGVLRQLFGGGAGAAQPTTTSTTPALGQQGIGSGTSAFGQSATGATGLAGAATGAATSTANTANRTITSGNVPTGTVSAGGAGLAGTVQIIADEQTNSLIVRASHSDYQQIRKVIERLDRLPSQVLIQVMVAEVQLNDTLQYGVEWWLNSMLSKNGRGYSAGFGLDGAIKPPSVSSTSTLGQVAGAASGFSYAVLNSASQVVGLLNLLGNDTSYQILSAPHVLTADGKIARIEVGNDQPIITQTVSAPTSSLTGTTFSTSNSVTYRPTGILLEVKPSISSSGMVAMTVSQEVSEVNSTPVQVGGSSYPSFTKRKVTTDVQVEDGKTVLIGGLIKDKGNDTVVGVPGLKDVPLVGALFGTTSRQYEKSELLITITPRIVRNRDDADQLTTEFRNAMYQLNANPAQAPRGSRRGAVGSSPSGTGNSGSIYESNVFR